ncbi:Wound-induced protein WIN2, partial [Linum grandiflorum]
PAKYCGSTDPYCKPCPGKNNCKCYREYCKPPAGTSTRRYSNGTDNENTIIATYDRNFTTTASSLTSHDNMLVAWRSNYGWATICVSSSSSTVSKHHDDAQCLKVSNSENGKQAVVRVVKNECSNPSLVLDYDVFQQLRNTATNNAQEYHLLISYMYVHCMDY